MAVVAKRATYPQLYACDDIVTFEHGFNFLPMSVELAQRFGELQGVFYLMQSLDQCSSRWVYQTGRRAS